jgi:pentatricopeptide repeat protein
MTTSTSSSFSTNTTASEHDDNDYTMDSLLDDSDRHNTSATTKPASRKDYALKRPQMIYRPFLDKWVNAAHFKEPKKKPKTVADYNRHILFAVRNDQQNKAIKYFRDMERCQLKPDTVTYTSIIIGYSRQPDMVRAKKWLKRMRANGVRPDVYIYTSMIDGYMRLCDVDRAEGVFRTMMQRRVQPNIVTYNVLMHHSVVQLDTDTAIKFWTKLSNMGLAADVYSYAILIQGLGNEAMVDEAWRVFEKMKKQGVDVNHVVATTLMGILVKHKDNSYGIQLFQDFFTQQQPQQLMSPTNHTRNIVLNAAMGHIEVTQINTYYDEFLTLVDGNTPPSSPSPLWGDQVQSSNHVFTYTSFMRAFLRHNDIGMVSQVYQDMIARKVKPTVVTFGTLMLAHAFVPDPQACENMLKELKTHGVKVNVALYTILMRAWAKAKQWEQVKRVYDDMKAAQIQPNKMTMEVLRWAKERTTVTT